MYNRQHGLLNFGFGEIRFWPLRVVKYVLSFPEFSWSGIYDFRSEINSNVDNIQYALSEHLISGMKYALSEAWVNIYGISDS
ncbi:unnamed protein product [Rhizophagus irregularis]|nr:unnamed protein product [Rhizophagus irregularis]